jgi:hypothetical protein
MREILLAHPLIFLYLLYVVGVLLAAFWPKAPGLTGDEGRAAKEESSATGEYSP